jgi:hypothetical protein
MRVKEHNAAQMRQSPRLLHHKHKTSNIFLVHAVRRINEAFFDKTRVHNFPFELVKISSGKRTTAQWGHRKSTFSINLCPLRPPAWSTNILRPSPVGPSRRCHPWARLSGRWAISVRLSIVTWGIGCRSMGAWSIQSQSNINTRCCIISFGPILEQIVVEAWGGFWNSRNMTVVRTRKQEF